MKNFVSLALIAGIALTLNLLSKQFFFRMDLTKDKRYTLSEATRSILKNLEDPVLIKAYFSKDLGLQYERGTEEFQDLVLEYANISKGMVDYEFIDPLESPELEQEVQQLGIPPVQIQSRENDNLAIKKGYLGARIELGDQAEIIPVVQPGMALEYALTTAIKKMSVLDKPSIGIVSGFGCLGAQELPQVYQQLGILYNVEPLDLSTAEDLTPARYKSIALMGAKDSIPPIFLAKLDGYLEAGGGILVGVNAVNGDLQGGQGTATPTGVEVWLMTHGIKVEEAFVIDENCGNITIQEQQGFFRMNKQLPFPFLPILKDFADHPITKGIEGVILPFASPINYVGDENAAYFPLAFSSNTSGKVGAPTVFDVLGKKWTPSDFNSSQIHMMGLVQKNVGGRLIVVGDGDFPTQARGEGGDNVSLMTNALDFLSDDTGLIELRTKGVAFRPIEVEEDRKPFLKWFNFLFPILLVAGYGFYRHLSRKSIRNQRLQEDYS